MIQIVMPSWIDKKHGRPALEALARGFVKLGLGAHFVSIEDARPSRVSPLVCWGIEKKRFPQRRAFGELQAEQRWMGGGLVILERGFVRREDRYYVGLDDLNGRGRQPHGFDAPPDRWRALGVELKPWRIGDGEVLIIGQVPWDTSCQHVDFSEWIREAHSMLIERMPKASIVFRPHPLQPFAIKPPPGVRVDRGPLEAALQRAQAVVTFSSTVGVDATIAGVPVVASDPMSMVHRLWVDQVDRRVLTPDRQPWANWLAYCQWSLEELASGAAWEHIQKGLPCKV